MLIPRDVENTLLRLAKEYPVVAVTGPRQSGKTTLVRSAFADRSYVSLEDLDERETASLDPRGFLARYPNGAILDEVQRCPGLFSYLQTHVDQVRRKGVFILTGSQQFGLLSGATQSLAGRVGLLVLLPFSLPELRSAGMAPKKLSELLFDGLYPPIYDTRPQSGPWYGNYLRTYLERDVRQIVNVRDLAAFQRFVRTCAGRTAQLTSLSGLAADCGVTHNTARAWLSVLEASYVIHFLQPHHRNFNKRMIKTPKLYLWDTGIVCRLLGIQTAEQVEHHPLRGALFETWVVAELLKGRHNRGMEPNLYFWRDRSGNEVDVLLDEAGTLTPVEIKAGATISTDSFRGLDRWKQMAGEEAGASWLVYGGKETRVRQGHRVLSWRDIGELTSEGA